MTSSAEVITNIQRNADIEAGTMALVVLSGENSRDHGFHDDWPEAPGHMPSQREVEDLKQQWRRAIAEKLALVHEEVSEALGEIRSGRDPLEVYFMDTKGKLGAKGIEYEAQDYGMDGVPLLKPEGFLVELADANIRIADLAYLVGDIDGAHLADATAVKAEYNRTRPYKHGRKF